ncbi:MAG: DnaJ domain-containing protein [Actinomycetota bacterium]|nr:DnaJ domain-containing protein [Actinomycetota bacterium]
MIDPLDHYRTLGVPASASPDELRDAYRALARRLHPDRVADPSARRSADDRMAKVNEAWRVLGDPDLRAAYDRSRQPPVATSAPSVDAREYGRRGDSFDDVAVSSSAGCALRVVPMVVTLTVLLGILIATAVLGPEGEVPARMEVGRCVELATTVKVVPCTAQTPVIVARGVAGTSCPAASVAVMLPSRTEQVCVAPPGTPVP